MTGSMLVHPQEKWNAAKCEQLSKKRLNGGPVGVGHNPHHYAHGRYVKYNGGCVHDGVWYQGEEWPLPELAEGFEWRELPAWGPQIVKVKP